MCNRVLLLVFCLFVSGAQSKEALVVSPSLLDQVKDGNADVAYFIAKLYLDGSEVYEKDRAQAMIWLEKSANMGHAHAMNILAGEYHDDNNKELALQWYRKAADAGLANAFGAIGSYYLVGDAGLEKDCNIAYEWYEKAQAREVKLAYNNHAWYMATASDKNCRNPEKAVVVYAQLKALFKSGNEKMPWNFVDTEAAVLASISDFSAAIKLQMELIEELKSYNVDTTNYQLHLDQYMKRKPWIEVITD